MLGETAMQRTRLEDFFILDDENLPMQLTMCTYSLDIAGYEICKYGYLPGEQYGAYVPPRPAILYLSSRQSARM